MFKDLVEQVRTVHFTVLLISFVMLVAGLAPNHRQITRAYDQALAIKSLTVSVNEDSGFQLLDEAEAASIVSIGDHQELILETFDPNDVKKEQDRLTVEKLVLDRGGARLKQHGSYQFGTLNDFRNLWENPPIVYGLRSSVGVTAPLHPSQCIVIQHRKGVHGLGGLDSCKPVGITQESIDCEVGISEGPVVRCTWPIPGIALVHGDASAFRTRILPGISKASGNFTTDFPELAEQARDQMSSPLDSIVTTLAARSEGPSDRIEILGAKIPLENIAMTGALLLVSAQLYLLMHLTELGRRLKEQSDSIPPVGFIGLYPQRWTRMIFVVSLSLPVVAETYALFRTWGGDISRLAINVPIIIGSSALMLWCMKVALPVNVPHVAEAPTALNLDE